MSNEPRQIWEWTPDDEHNNARDDIWAGITVAAITVLVLMWAFVWGAW